MLGGINSGTERLTLYVISHMKILALNLLFCVLKLEQNCMQKLETALRGRHFKGGK